jgi:DNA polymerase III alpha subunit (gram-positive type)
MELKVIGFDTETTGLDPKTAHIIEMGAILYSVEDGVWKQQKAVNELVYNEAYDFNSEDAKTAMKINGISLDELKEKGISFNEALQKIHAMGEVDFMVAHNAEYDKNMLAADCIFNNVHSRLLDVDWVCSSRDISYTEKYRISGLFKIAAGQGLVVDPKSLHRAVADVSLMGDVLSSVGADPRAMLATKKIPTLVLTPNPSPRKPWEDNYASVNIAKQHGYGFEKAVYKTYEKKWVKAVKADKLAEEKLPYTVLEEIQNGW